MRIQTQPGFVSTLRAGAPIIYQQEGLNGFYKSLVPLWMRQIPYTMMKFACFERTVEVLYKWAIIRFHTASAQTEILNVWNSNVRLFLCFQVCRSQATWAVHQVRAVGGHIRCWLHCWCVLCHCVSSRRYRGLQTEPRQGKHCWRRGEEAGLRWTMEGSCR